MRKRKIKRYTLVVKQRSEMRFLNTEEDVERIMHQISKYNSQKGNPFLCGGFKKEYVNGKIVLSFIRYKKLDKPDTLESIDSYTTELNNSTPLREKYKVNNSERIEIALRQNGDISLLPLLYKRDKIYFDKEYLRREFVGKCMNINFLNGIIKDEYLNNCGKKEVFCALDELIRVREKIKAGLYDKRDIISPAYDLYSAIVTKKDGSLDYRLKRFLIDKIKEQNESEQLRVDREISLINELSTQNEENYQYTLFDHGQKTTN